MSIVDAAVEPAAFTAEARAIARTHHDNGATPEMYGWVGTALLATLRGSAPSAWSPEAERAWTAAYENLTRLVTAEP